ncbi:protein of unknown function [Thiomonas sp. Sup16B3]|nr:protein of unknown function [Thiomonas sp. Sup16B3]
MQLRQTAIAYSTAQMTADMHRGRRGWHLRLGSAEHPWRSGKKYRAFLKKSAGRCSARSGHVNGLLAQAASCGLHRGMIQLQEAWKLQTLGLRCADVCTPAHAAVRQCVALTCPLAPYQR